MSKIHLSFRVDSDEREFGLVLTRGKKLMVGRDADWLRISHPSVSRKHFYLEYDGDNVTIWDNASTNGTFVDGELPSGKRLSVGDVILFGDCAMEVLRLEGVRKGVQLQKAQESSWNLRSRTPITEKVDAARKASGEQGLGRSLEALLMHPQYLPDFFKYLVMHPLDFFDGFSFRTPWKFSVSVIFGVSAMEMLLHPVILRSLGFSIFFAIIMGVIVSLFALGFSFLCERLRGVLRMKGEFAEYLAFSAMGVLVGVPVVLVAFLSQTLAAILSLYLWGLTLYGFYRVFKPEPVRASVAAVAVLVVPGMVVGFVGMVLVAGLSTRQARLDAMRAVATQREISSSQNAGKGRAPSKDSTAPDSDPE